MMDSEITGISSSISDTFVWGLIPAVLAIVAACLMSNEKHDSKAEMEAYAAAH
ncbi:hypothetical protein [Cohnella herbarum]|uniref:Uncharacterized protein n=1 Tax=Cohnella herbarum TaxID=2728023 RepID=A0A7Z2ZMM5_9BACL|nr:hypothetical protein [Cohnella herbarum]QJD85536.1 hypothetical protein HH215_21690 [Cohnella herbarum]